MACPVVQLTTDPATLCRSPVVCHTFGCHCRHHQTENNQRGEAYLALHRRNISHRLHQQPITQFHGFIRIPLHASSTGLTVQLRMVHATIHSSINPFAHPSVSLSIYPPIHPSIYPSACPSFVYMYLSITGTDLVENLCHHGRLSSQWCMSHGQSVSSKWAKL